MRELLNHTIEHADKIGIGIGAVASAVAAVLVPVLRKLRRIDKRIDALKDTSISGILKATASNIRALCEVADPQKLRTLDIGFEHGIYVSIPIIIGTTYSPYSGLEITGIRSNAECTDYSMQTTQPVTLVRHSHEEREIVEVLDGSMTDLDSGRVYRKGEAWDIEPNLQHRVYFEAHGLYIATIRPPLPLASERPVNVDRLHELAELT